MFEMGALPASETSDDALPDVEAAENADRRRWEKDLLGLHVSPSPLSNPGVREALRASVDTQIFDLDASHIGQNLTVGGLVADVRQLITQKGDTMAIVTLEDAPGTIEVVVFPRIWAQIGDSLEIDRVIVARGRLEDRRGSLQLVAENLFPPQPTADDLEDAATPASRTRVPDDRTGHDPEVYVEAAAVPSAADVGDDPVGDVEPAVNGDAMGAEPEAPAADADAPVEPTPVAGSLEVQAAGSEYAPPSDDDAPDGSSEWRRCAHAVSGEANGASNGGAPRRVVVVLRPQPGPRARHRPAAPAGRGGRRPSRRGSARPARRVAGWRRNALALAQGGERQSRSWWRRWSGSTKPITWWWSGRPPNPTSPAARNLDRRIRSGHYARNAV